MTTAAEWAWPTYHFDPLTGGVTQHPAPTPPEPEDGGCDHGVTFDEEAAQECDEYEVRRRWPRLHGPCPKGCGFTGIAYASAMHYVMGDW